MLLYKTKENLRLQKGRSPCKGATAKARCGGMTLTTMKRRHLVPRPFRVLYVSFHTNEDTNLLNCHHALPICHVWCVTLELLHNQICWFFMIRAKLAKPTCVLRGWFLTKLPQFLIHITMAFVAKWSIPRITNPDFENHQSTHLFQCCQTYKGLI